MRTLLYVAVCVASPMFAEEQPTKKAPAKLELCSGDQEYKDQKGAEKEFIGVLDRVVRKDDVGRGRENPYRLKMKNEIREVYVGEKLEKLLPYVGRTVKITGKAVDREVESQLRREIWPARLEVLPDEEKKP